MDSHVLHWTHVSTFSSLCLFWNIVIVLFFYFIKDRFSGDASILLGRAGFGGRLISLFWRWRSIAKCPLPLEILFPPFATSSAPGDPIFPPGLTFPRIWAEGQRLLLICVTLLTLLSYWAACAVAHLYCLSWSPENNFLPVRGGINNVAWAVRNITPFPPRSNGRNRGEHIHQLAWDQ